MNTTAKDSRDPKDAKQNRKAEEPAKPMDVTALSDTDLDALIAAAEQERTTRREKKRSEFFASIRDQARALGFDPAEVAAALAKKGKRAGTDRRAAVAPKYRNPANPAETWAGRGAKPMWVRAALEAGKKLDDLKIPA
jgi:DNA-binding protein H-NS